MREKTNHMRPKQKEEGGGRDEGEENKKGGERGNGEGIEPEEERRKR